MTWPQTNTAATRTKLGNLQSQTRKNDEMIKRNATITTQWEWGITWGDNEQLS